MSITGRKCDTPEAGQSGVQWRRSEEGLDHSVRQPLNVGEGGYSIVSWLQTHSQTATNTVRQLQTQSDSYKHSQMATNTVSQPLNVGEGGHSIVSWLQTHSQTATNTVRQLQTQSDSHSMWVRVDTPSYSGYKQNKLHNDYNTLTFSL